MSKASSKKRAVSAKKKGTTPESSLRDTPTGSSESIGENYLKTSVDAVIDDEEVAALYFKEEDLVKLHPPKQFGRESPTWPQRTKKVLVKVMEKISSQEKKKPRRISVLHPIPPGLKLLGTRTPGPCFDDKGSFIPHSILGTAEDYTKELKNRKIDSVGDFSQPLHIVETKLSKFLHHAEMFNKKTILSREEHALRHWKKSMELRRSQQQYLSEKLHTSPEKLTMNKGETYRMKLEERDLIGRAIPAVDCGKGFRVGSEFWKEQERIGDEETGIHLALTDTEKGCPPEIEFMDIPSIVHKERGTCALERGRNTPSHYTWHDSSYLSTRRKELAHTLAGPESFRPQFSQLQVVGHMPGTQLINSDVYTEVLPSSRFRIRTDSLDSLEDEQEIQERNDLVVDPAESEADLQKVIGPALRVGGILLKWMGPPPSPTRPISSEGPKVSQSDTVFLDTMKTSTRRRSSVSMGDLQRFRDTGNVESKETQQAVVEHRVNLESEAGVIATSYLDIENCGTTSIYFSWELIPKPNPLGTVQAGDTQRFYFDTRGGALHPGQKLKFPFMFKSMFAGIFSEIWLLATGPVLNQGKPFIVTLKGVATQDDIYKEDRDIVERILVHREAEAAADRIMRRIVDSIRTPPHSPPPIKDDGTLVEDFFSLKNPEMYYHYDVIQQLKYLHDTALCPDLFPEQDSLYATSTSRTEKAGGGKKWDASSTKKGTSKDKKLGKIKEEVSTDPFKELDLPKWNFSIDSLLEIIMNVEDETSRGEKLKKLNELVGALSFPPPPSMKFSSYHLCYQTMCEAMDTLTDISSRLCQVMGLPLRDWSSRSKAYDSEDINILSVPSSPAYGKSRKSGTTASRKESKKSTKERERVHTPSGKTKKSPKVSPKGFEPLNELQVLDEISCTSVLSETNSILEKKYKENFYVAAYKILVSAVDRMVLLMEGIADEK